MRKGFYLLLILLFPSIIYMLFSLGEHKVKRLGYYGSYEIVGSDTVYNPAPNLDLISSEDKKVSETQLEGNIVIVNLINWPCDDECYKQGATLANYLNDLGNNEKWMLLTICMDESAEIEELHNHANKYMVDMDNWQFLKPAKRASFEKWLNYVYLQTERVSAIDELPSNEFVILDQNGVVREYFNSRIYKENKKMQDALKMLMKEPHLSWKDEKE